MHGRVCGFNKQDACLSPDVGEFFVEVGTLRHQQSILPRNNGETHLHLTSAEDCQKHDPSDKSMCGTQDASHIGQLGCANHICGESGSFRRNKHSAALFYNPTQDVRMTTQSDFECLLDDGGHRHINTQIQRRSERQGRAPGFRDSNLNNLVMLNGDH